MLVLVVVVVVVVVVVTREDEVAEDVRFRDARVRVSEMAGR